MLSDEQIVTIKSILNKSNWIDQINAAIYLSLANSVDAKILFKEYAEQEQQKKDHATAELQTLQLKQRTITAKLKEQQNANEDLQQSILTLKTKLDAFEKALDQDEEALTETKEAFAALSDQQKKIQTSIRSLKVHDKEIHTNMATCSAKLAAIDSHALNLLENWQAFLQQAQQCLLDANQEQLTADDAAQLKTKGRAFEEQAASYFPCNDRILYWLVDYAGATCNRDDNGKMAQKAIFTHEQKAQPNPVIVQTLAYLDYINGLAAAREKLLRQKDNTPMRRTVDDLLATPSVDDLSKRLPEILKALPGQVQDAETLTEHFKAYLLRLTALGEQTTLFLNCLDQNKQTWPELVFDKCVENIQCAIEQGIAETRGIITLVEQDAELEIDNELITKMGITESRSAFASMFS